MASNEIYFKDIPEFIELLKNADMEINTLKKEIEELKKDRYLLNAETGEITKVGSNCVSKDKIREIIYPSPDNYIPVEVQMSEMYRKIEELLKESEINENN